MRGIVITGILIASLFASSASYASMTNESRAKFVASCEKQMYMSQPACECMADIADKKLDDTAIAYLSLDALDVRNSAAMSKSMTSKEIASIDTFMRTAPKQCKDAK